MSDCLKYAPAAENVKLKNCGTCQNWDAVTEKCGEVETLKKLQNLKGE